MLDILFKFPIAMVDGDAEEAKHLLALPNEDEVDIIYGEAEVPYHDFVGIIDRWLPTAESRARAAEGEFDACHVMFSISGSYLVPWNKEKFKAEIGKFAEQFNKVVLTTKKQIKELYDALPDDKDTQE